jgi:hypothetical protein
MSQHQTIALDRWVKAVRKAEENASAQPSEKPDQPNLAQNVAELRDLQAWVLLGEPGAGKSSVFHNEAIACGGVHLEIAKFLTGNLPEQHKGKCLFLDGLDEYRNPGNEGRVLSLVESKLRELGTQKFRIACRAADWLGTTDQSDIAGATAQSKIPVFALEPLSEVGVTTLSQHFLQTTDVEEFLTQAKNADLDALLTNPQILELITKAYQEDRRLPSGRLEAYERGCALLVKEANKRQRDKRRSQSTPDDEQLLEAAGQIFAALLLGNQAGIALDSGVENERYALLEKLKLANDEAAQRASDSKLFVLGDQEEQLVPAHRTIAEYLAARWLSAQLKEHKRTLRRLLPLLCGFDGKAVSNLRGLYGWLATHCVNNARTELIRKDAITVALYGDPMRFDLENKRRLFTALRQTLQANPAAISEMWHRDLLGPVLLNDLLEEFIAVLNDAAREDDTQRFCKYLLSAANAAFKRPNAYEPKHLSALNQALEVVVRDASRRGDIRENALETWLNTLQDKSVALKLLHQVHQDQVSDPEDTLILVLLDYLYQHTLSTADLLPYLRAPKLTDRNAYATFWGYIWPKRIPSQDLPYALNFLVRYTNLKALLQDEYMMGSMIPSLVNRAIVERGDAVDHETLFEWITLGTDKYWFEFVARSDAHPIAWWKARPDRYKGVLGVAFARASAAPLPDQGKSLFASQKALAMINAAKPVDMGLWHFEQMNQPYTEWRLQAHLKETMRSVLYRNEEEGVTLEMVQAWAGNNPDRLTLLRSELLCPLDAQTQPYQDIFREHQRFQEQLQQRQQAKYQRSTQLEPLLPAIESGTATPNLMYELAQVWAGNQSNDNGNTPIDYFKDYCNNYQAVHDASRRGLIAYLQRNDLPSPVEIIGNWVHRKLDLFHMGITCMVGADLLWSEKPEAFDALNEVTLERLVSFWWTDSGFSSTRKWNYWLGHLIQNQHELVIRVSVDFVLVQFKIFQASPDLFALKEPIFEPVVERIVMGVLQRLPNRLDSHHLGALGWLLATALTNESAEKVSAIIEEKVNAQEVDAGQTVYWLLAGTLLAPQLYESQLLEYVANNWQRLEHLSDAMRHFYELMRNKHHLPAPTLGRFIECLAPHANFVWPTDGRAHDSTPADNLGDQVRAWVSQLATHVAEESLTELNRLRQSTALLNCNGLNDQLQMAHHQLTQQLRQARYQVPTLPEVIKILTNKAPTNAADLQAVVLDRLDQIAKDIKGDNSNLYKQFWKDKTSHKIENDCRDALLPLLRSGLSSIGISAEPEATHVNSTQSDIDISYVSEHGRFKVPIEVKGEWHKDLWTAINTQVPQYTKAKETDGYAIYLVLWVGGCEQKRVADGGKRPTTSAELEERLTAQIAPEAAGRFVVRVLDISYPGRNAC